jgi:ribonucleoside-diphosphate reductase beta chain
MTLMEFAPVDVPTPEAIDLGGLVRVDIDQVIDYVHSAGTAKLPGYLELYSRYLRQRWNVDELDFTQDAEDWKQMPEDAKGTFLYVASGFHHGERQVEVELAPLLFGIPEDYKIFLTSHLEDEARHTVFFDRFYREVVGLPGDSLMEVLDGSYQWVGETFIGPFGLLSYLTDQLRRDPYDPSLLMQYATTYMLWIEGVLALAVMKLTLGYARDNKILPAYYAGFTATCRDEARHVQGGMRYIRDLLDQDPRLVADLHDTLRTILTISATNSEYVVYEPIGWTEQRVTELLVDQLNKKLAMIGVDVPDDIKAMIAMISPQLAGG